MAQAIRRRSGHPERSRRMKMSVIVCAHNEAHYLPTCLYSLLAQSRIPDEILVINNASTDATRAVAAAGPARARGGRAAQRTGHRARNRPARRRGRPAGLPRRRLPGAADVACSVSSGTSCATRTLLALSGPYRYYDWNWWGRTLIRALRLHPRACHAAAGEVRAAASAPSSTAATSPSAATRSTRSAGSTRPSSFTVRTPISDAG